MKRLLLVLVMLLGIGANTSGFALELKKQAPVVKPETTVGTQASVLYAENSIDKAFELLLTIPEEDRTPQDYLLLGNILQDKGKNGEAIFMYNKAVQEDEKYVKAYYNLGVIYLQEDKPNLAIQQFKKAIKLNPEQPYAHYNLGCAYIKIGELRKAKYEILTATDFNNNVADFHYNLAYIYKKLGNEKQAARYLEYYNKLNTNL